MGSVYLDGLREEPLAGLLAGKGVLRLLREQAGVEVTSEWRQGRMVLHGDLNEEALVRFFLHRYQPTPLASPWNGGSGFYGNEDSRGREAIESSEDLRFSDYRAALEAIRDVLVAMGIEEKPSTPEVKVALLKALKKKLRGRARLWLDAVVTMEGDKPGYHGLFFSGGNDGRFDFARHFMERVHLLLIAADGGSESLLKAALFDQPSEHHISRPAGPFFPFSAGGMNASSAFEGEALSNPWSYLLALEGALALLASPIPHHPVGQVSLVPEESLRSDLLIDGRVFSPLPRNGRNNFFIQRESRFDPLLQPVLDWLENEKLDTLALCRARTRVEALERLGEMKLFASDLDLDPGWLGCGDGSPEFGLALTLAGLGRSVDLAGNPLLDVRLQLKMFAGKDTTEKMLSLLKFRVRSASRVMKNLNHVGIRRFNGPLWSTYAARATDVETFLARRTDDARLERLLHGLVLAAPRLSEPQPEELAFLPSPLLMAQAAFHHAGDHRAPPETVIAHLENGDAAKACRACAEFLTGRELNLEVRSSPSLRDGRRVAASLLFPISDLRYDTILTQLGARHV